jgi:hypothetical protein
VLTRANSRFGNSFYCSTGEHLGGDSLPGAVSRKGFSAQPEESEDCQNHDHKPNDRQNIIHRASPLWCRRSSNPSCQALLCAALQSSDNGGESTTREGDAWGGVLRRLLSERENNPLCILLPMIATSSGTGSVWNGFSSLATTFSLLVCAMCPAIFRVQITAHQNE